MRETSLSLCPMNICLRRGILFIHSLTSVHYGFPGGSEVKAFACNVGDLGSIPGSGISAGEGNGNPTPVLLPGESHGRRSLVGCSPWGHRESDTTERLHLLAWYTLSTYLFP